MESVGDVVAVVDGPLHDIQMLTDRHFIVVGGDEDGSSNNRLKIFQLTFDGYQCVAIEVGSYDTGTKSIKSGAAFQGTKSRKIFFLAVHNDHIPRLYSISEKFATINYVNVLNFTHVRMAVEPHGIQPEIEFADASQKVACISSHGKWLATGGSDGFIRIRKFPSLHFVTEIKAHTQEVDDLCFSPDNQRLVSVSKDGNAFIWSVKRCNLARLSTLEWTPPEENLNYVFAKCRFSVSENDGHRPHLFTIANSREQTSGTAGFLQRWDTSNLLLSQSLSFLTTLSALAVSPCGKYVAVGSAEAGYSVRVYTTFDLQPIAQVENAQSPSITGLQFIPCHTNAGKNNTGLSDIALLSISADKKIRVHRVELRTSCRSSLVSLSILSLRFVTAAIALFLPRVFVSKFTPSFSP